MRAFGKKAFLLLVLILPPLAWASDYTVRIRGLAKGAEGREIVWRADSDPFSMRSIELDRCRIDENGVFELKTDRIAAVLPTYLVIDYYTTGFFAQAGSDYQMRMAAFDYHTDESRNAFVPSNQLPILRYTLLDAQGKPDTADLNALLGRYSQLYARLVETHLEQISIQQDTQPIVDFIRMADSLFKGENSVYFKTYRRYTEAGLEDFAGLLSRKELYEKYLAGQPLDENNPAWVSFVKSYFTDYFATNRFLPFAQVARILNRKDFSAAKRATSLADSMGLDYALKGERLREWVFINACAEIRGNERINEKNLVEMLRYLQAHTKFSNHAEAIKNLLQASGEAKERHYFDGVILTDSTGNEVLVESLLEKDKFHYFMFVRAGYERCPSCRSAADLLEKIWKAASEDVHRTVKIIFINCDYPFAAYYHDAKRRHYPWPYLHFNGNIEWIRTIDAARFPSYVLVDDKGNVLNSDFTAPGNDLKHVFEQMGQIRLRKDRLQNGTKD